MKHPCHYKPLAVCDPNTVDRSRDHVRTAMIGMPCKIKDQKSSQGSLRYHEDQKWYYYPEMNWDEVMVFKQFEYFKDLDEIENSKERTCFHTAFHHPSTTACTERRMSCEHRVTIYFDQPVHRDEFGYTTRRSYASRQSARTSLDDEKEDIH